MSRLRCLALILTSLPALASPASFDCSRAETWVERAICAEPNLEALDERLAQTYRSARNAAKAQGADAAQRLLNAQRAWLAERNQCDTHDCLSHLYRTRIETLSDDPPALSNAPALVSQPRRIQESGPGYSVDARFPLLSDLGPSTMKINRQIRDLVQGLIDPFIADRREVAAETSEGFDEPSWGIEIDYAEPDRARHYVAILFNGYDYRGGAHGMPIIAPLVIALSDARPIPPAGLFRPGTAWLDTLSTLCRRELSQRDLLSQDEDWLRSGTAPTEENYQLLYPGPNGLKVIFPPYAVAPYAAGAQEVTIPYAQLHGLLASALFED